LREIRKRRVPGDESVDARLGERDDLALVFANTEGDDATGRRCGSQDLDRLERLAHRHV